MSLELKYYILVTDYKSLLVWMLHILHIRWNQFSSTIFFCMAWAMPDTMKMCKMVKMYSCNNEHPTPQTPPTSIHTKKNRRICFLFSGEACFRRTNGTKRNVNAMSKNLINLIKSFYGKKTHTPTPTHSIQMHRHRWQWVLPCPKWKCFKWTTFPIWNRNWRYLVGVLLFPSSLFPPFMHSMTWFGSLHFISFKVIRKLYSKISYKFSIRCNYIHKMCIQILPFRT